MSTPGRGGSGFAGLILAALGCATNVVMTRLKHKCGVLGYTAHRVSGSDQLPVTDRPTAPVASGSKILRPPPPQRLPHDNRHVELSLAQLGGRARCCPPAIIGVTRCRRGAATAPACLLHTVACTDAGSVITKLRDRRACAPPNAFSEGCPSRLTGVVQRCVPSHSTNPSPVGAAGCMSSQRIPTAARCRRPQLCLVG